MHFEGESAGKVDKFANLLVSVIDLLEVGICTVFFLSKDSFRQSGENILQYFQKIECYHTF